jgi:transposase
MTAQVWAEIRRLHIIEGLSARHIGRMMRLDKKTVRRAIMLERFQDKRGNSGGGELKLAPYVKDIAEFLEKYPAISGQRIYEEILKRGYTGKITILRDYLRNARIYTRPAYLRIETLPAEQAQVDWADCGSIKVGEYSRKLSCFVMVLSYSRLMYLEFTLSQRMETFMNCHVNAFKFFEGIPQKILYDNLKSVVLVRFGREIRFNPRFEVFRGHYMFEAIPCNPGCANEKGKVENGIKYVKRNFMVGRVFKSFSDLKAQSVEWRDKTANNRIHGTTRKQPSELYLLERDKLRKLAANDYDTSIVIPTKSSKDCRVTFDTNTYSVPFKYASCAVTIRVASEQIMIYTGNTLLIASHTRSYEKYQVIEDPKHYQGLIDSG